MSAYGMNKMGVNLNVPLSSALFTVDSRDGIRTDTATGFVIDAQNPYDIQIYKNQQLFSGAVQRIALTEINMPFSVPNVNPYNNILVLESETGETFKIGEDVYINEFGDPVVTEITPGFYTPQQLASTIQGFLNAGTGVFDIKTWVVSYSNDIPANPELGMYGKATFNIGQGIVKKPFRINPMFGKDKGSYTYNGVTTRRSSTLAEMMGFGSVSGNYVVSYSGDYASMLYTNYVDIVSPFLSKNMEVRDTSSSYVNGYDIVARIYIARDGYDNCQALQVGGTTFTNLIGTRPFHIHSTFPVPKQIRWSPTEFLPSCNLRLQDMYGNVLYSSPTKSFSSTVIGGIGEVCGNTSWVEMNFLISEISTQ